MPGQGHVASILNNGRSVGCQRLAGKKGTGTHHATSDLITVRLRLSANQQKTRQDRRTPPLQEIAESNAGRQLQGSFCAVVY